MSYFLNNDKILRKLKELDTKRDHDKYWNISKELGLVLTNLTLMKKPKNVLEFGTSNGYSGLCMIKGLDENSKFTSIEVDSGRHEEAKKNISFCDLKNITLIEGEIFEVLNSGKFDGQLFDMIFLDAAHKNYREVVETLLKNKLINDETLIVADNVVSHSMDSFIDFMRMKFAEVEIIRTDSGFLVAKRTK